VLNVSNVGDVISIMKIKITTEFRENAVSQHSATTSCNCSCIGAFVTDQSGVQSKGHRLSPHPRTLTSNQTAIRSPGLPWNYVYRHHRDKRVSWLGWLTQSRHFTHRVVTCQP